MKIPTLDINVIRASAKQVADDADNGLCVQLAIQPGPGAAAMKTYLRELEPNVVLALCALAEHGAQTMAEAAIAKLKREASS